MSLPRVDSATEPSGDPMDKSEDRYAPEKRWSEKVISLGWTPVPNLLLRHIHKLKNGEEKSLNPTQVLVLILLASYKWDDRMPYPTVGVMATQLDLGQRAVRAALKELEDRVLLKRVRSKYGGPNRYDISPLIAKLEELKDTVSSEEGSDETDNA